MACRAVKALAATGALVVATVACADDGPRAPDAAVASVMRIETWRCGEPNRFSGYGVNVDGQILTAAHVVEGQLRELLVDGVPATVTSVDERTDLATLRLGAPTAVADLAPREVHPASGPPVAMPADEAWLIAGDGTGISHAGEGDDVIGAIPVQIRRETRLVVDNISTHTTVERNAIVFTPGVDDGTSGAPLVNATGELIGIVVLSSRYGEQAYAVRIDEIAQVVERSRRMPPVSGTRSPAAACHRW